MIPTSFTLTVKLLISASVGTFLIIIDCLQESSSKFYETSLKLSNDSITKG